MINWFWTCLAAVSPAAIANTFCIYAYKRCSDQLLIRGAVILCSAALLLPQHSPQNLTPTSKTVIKWCFHPSSQCFFRQFWLQPLIPDAVYLKRLERNQFLWGWDDSASDGAAAAEAFKVAYSVLAGTCFWFIDNLVTFCVHRTPKSEERILILFGSSGRKGKVV